MSKQAKAKFNSKSWDENPYSELDGGRKLTRAEVTQEATGDIEGEASTQWLMAYRPDETADFTGLQLVEGSLDGHEGTFVMHTRGTFDGKVAAGDLEVVPGSGTGELEGLTGKGSFSAPHGPEAEVELEYDLG